MLSLIVLGLGCLLAGSEGAAVGQCTTPNSYTHDDQTCRTYYICTRTGWLAGTCPGTQYFNPNLVYCVPQDQYRCPYDTSSSGTTRRGCTQITCRNGGRCTVSLDGFGQCRCLPGFDGDRCQNVLASGSTGTSGTSGTSGSSSSTTTTQTCADLTCRNGGRCFQETPTRAQCYCPTPFGGSLCGLRLNSDGICPVARESNCNPGCENGGKCFLENGAAKCFCPEGFNGDNCEITLDKCTVKDCRNGGTCNVDANGDAKCTCPEPYSGENCQLQVSSACWALNCENNAGCRQVGRTTQCDCPDGFIGDRCQFKDPCPDITCLHNGKCEAGDKGQAVCDCEVGYTGNFCEIALDCEGFTCYNGGKCKIESNERKCDCPDRTTGDKCEKRLQCHGDGKAPCQNEGKCVSSDNGFQCVCPLGRRGLFCEELSTCSENIVCENGGRCDDAGGKGAACLCATGFKGPRCEVKEDDCGGCENGGICELPPLLPASSPDSDKVCACPAGFKGELCETETACTTPCPETTGASGERYHTFVYPDLEKRDYVFLCRLGRLSHVQYCEDGLWYDPFAMECHNDKSFAAARQTAGDALYPTSIP